MDKWKAHVQLGQAEATIGGIGAVNLLDVLADALAIANLALNQVIIVAPNTFMVGYSIGTTSGLIANITIEVV